MAGLLIVGVVVVLIALYLAERFIKARAKARRLQEMNDRLAVVTARVDEQQAEKRAAARARDALTNVMPAINRPPLSLPGVPPHGKARSKASCERPARRGGRTGDHSFSGDHGVRTSERHGA